MMENVYFIFFLDHCQSHNPRPVAIGRDLELELEGERANGFGMMRALKEEKLGRFRRGEKGRDVIMDVRARMAKA